MSVFEAMMMDISFSTLMVFVIALSFTFTKKSKAPSPPKLSSGLLMFS